MELTEETIKNAHCYTCGRDHTYELRQIDEPIIEGKNTVILPITVGVCSFCGTRVVDTPTAARLQEVRALLKQGKVTGFTPIGVTYRSA